MAKWKKIGLIVGLLLLVLVLVGTSCAPAAKPGERVVKIGLHSVFTGALATTGVACFSGIIDHVRYINEQGGLDGVKLETIWRETGATVPPSIVAHRRFKEGGVVVEVSIIGSQFDVLAPALQRDKVPGVLPTYQTEITLTKPIRWVFTGSPSNADVAAAALRWYKEEKWRETGRAPRAATFFYDHLSGWQANEGVKWAAAKYGFEFAGYEAIPMLGAIDTTTEWLRLAGKKPDIVYYMVCGASNVAAYQDALRLGIQEKGVTFVDGYCLADLIPIVGAEKVDGWYEIRQSPSYMETDLPEVKVVLEAAKKYRGWDSPHEGYMFLWLCTAVVVEGIRLAIEKVGLDNLDGEAVRDGLASIRDFDSGLHAPITMSDAKPWYAKGYKMLEARKGKMYPVSDWIEFPGYAKEKGWLD